MKKISKIQFFRYIVLTVFLIIVSVTAYRHQVLGGGPEGSASIHAICPFGGLETLFKYVAGGEYLKRTNISNFILLAGTIILALLLGRFFCGWICMLGWIQELPARLGKYIFKKRFIIPVAVDRPLRYLKYILLIVILYFTWKMSDLVFGPFDPFAAYAHIPAGTGELFGEYLVGTIVLFGSLILSFFYDRFFCKYLCPMGAFLAIVDKLGIYKIKRDEETCINCNKCTKACPVNIDVTKLETVKDAECINCMECVTGCPTKKETLKTVPAGKSFRPGVVAVAGVVIFVGIITTTNLLGVWKTTAGNLTEVVSKEGGLDPYSIRGYMTLDQIARTFNIDIALLYKELKLNQEQVPAETKMKELEDIDKTIEEDSVRDAVAKIIGYEKPKKSTETDSLPDPASIKGTMTIKEIVENYDISKEDLLTELNVPDPDSIKGSTTGKELMGIMTKTDPTFEVETIRNAVKNLIAKK